MCTCVVAVRCVCVCVCVTPDEDYKIQTGAVCIHNMIGLIMISSDYRSVTCSGILSGLTLVMALPPPLPP